MRLTRLFLDRPLAVGATVELDERSHRHAVQVLRLRPGAEITLFNGRIGEFRAVLTRAEKRRAEASITGFSDRDTRPRLRVILIQGVSKGDRMDYSLQKATELGVSEIQPVLTQRSQAPDDSRRLENRRAHWCGVVISACEQCGRTDLPYVHPVLPFPEWLEVPPRGHCLVLDPLAPVGLSGLPPGNSPPDPVALLVGPEGGLQEAETAAAVQHGFHAIRLGPRILRTETAGVAALAVIQAYWGDLDE